MWITGPVLIVEDDPAWQDELASMVSEAGFKYAIADDYGTGLDYLFTLRPSVLVLDLALTAKPAETGEFAGWKLAREALTRGTPIIVVTGYASVADANRAFREYKAVAFLDKGSLTKQEVMERISEAVSQRRTLSEDEKQALIRELLYIVGPPIEDIAHFYGRRREVDRFFAHVNSPQPPPLQLLGIRRAGKTSLLKYIAHPEVVREKALDATHTLVAYVDLQAGANTPADFYISIAEAIVKGLSPSGGLELPDEFPNIRTFKRWLDAPQLTSHRCIVLLDEFETLREKEEFNLDFFKGLRSLVGGRLAWVTTSYRNLYRLSRKLGRDEKTSPFFNVFHPTPIVLGPLSPPEAEELIQGPVRASGISFTAEELDAIQGMAGRLPFFLQAVASNWILNKSHGWTVQRIAQEVSRQLRQDMAPHFEWYWLHFTDAERDWLKLIAAEPPHDPDIQSLRHSDEALDDLFRYGLLTTTGHQIRVASSVFAEWIRRQGEEPVTPLSDHIPYVSTSRFQYGHALIIGVGAYHNVRPLAKTTTDARDLYDLLAKSGYPTANLTLLLDDQATKGATSDKLDWLAHSVGPDDTVVIFFSGHGAQRIGGFEPGEYLCPVEADWYKLRTTAISTEEFTTALRAIHAGRVAVLLDACHAGGMGEPKDTTVQVKAGLSEDTYTRLAEGRGRVVIASCRPDEASWELKGMRNSLFTHYLLEALRGAAAGADGTVRVFDVFNHVSKHVPQHKPQHPLFKGEIELNFAIARFGAGTR